MIFDIYIILNIKCLFSHSQYRHIIYVFLFFFLHGLYFFTFLLKNWQKSLNNNVLIGK